MFLCARGSDGLAACRLTCTVGSIVGACAGCGMSIYGVGIGTGCWVVYGISMGVVRLLRGMDGCWSGVWVWCVVCV